MLLVHCSQMLPSYKQTGLADTALNFTSEIMKYTVMQNATLPWMQGRDTSIETYTYQYADARISCRVELVDENSGRHDRASYLSTG